MKGAFTFPSSPNCAASLAARDSSLPVSPDADDHIDFKPGTTLPSHLFHWRLSVAKNYPISPAIHRNTLRLTLANLHLTAWDGDSTHDWGQNSVVRRPLSVTRQLEGWRLRGQPEDENLAQ